PSNSPIHPLLANLPLLNLEVGEDDITADKDYKHVFKWLRNLLVHNAGTVVRGFHLKDSIIKQHLLSNGVKKVHLDRLFKVDDKQDVKLAYNFLNGVAQLPDPPSDSKIGFSDARKSLQILGWLFRQLLLPYTCVDLTLTEQLIHLSAAAHLLLALAVDS